MATNKFFFGLTVFWLLSAFLLLFCLYVIVCLFTVSTKRQSEYIIHFWQKADFQVLNQLLQVHLSFTGSRSHININHRSQPYCITALTNWRTHNRLFPVIACQVWICGVVPWSTPNTLCSLQCCLPDHCPRHLQTSTCIPRVCPSCPQSFICQGYGPTRQNVWSLHPPLSL